MYSAVFSLHVKLDFEGGGTKTWIDCVTYL